MSAYPFVFEGAVAYYAFERYAYTVLYLPDDVATLLPFEAHPRLRVTGEVADIPVEGAWQPAGDGRRYFILSRRFLRVAGIAVGDVVEMRFAIADQNAVIVPEALAAALTKNRAIDRKWRALTPGAQRAFAHRVASAKAEATRARRVAEVLDMVDSGARPGAPAKKRR